jgi:predicted nucleotidyltransferase
MHMNVTTQGEWAEVDQLLGHHDAVAFGSRATGHAKRFADLDICILSPLSLAELAELREGFDESNLPFVVDLCRWEDLSADFRQAVARDGVRPWAAESATAPESRSPS